MTRMTNLTMRLFFASAPLLLMAGCDTGIALGTVPAGDSVAQTSPDTVVQSPDSVAQAVPESSIDDCPNNPDKTTPGECGCGRPDTDTDSDGYADCVDSCPNDPDKVFPGLCGCGSSETDTDGDGTLDCNDNCPNDPNKTTPGQCGCGLREADADSDGIPDCLDECPTDPEKTVPGECGCAVVDRLGCANMPPFASAGPDKHLNGSANDLAFLDGIDSHDPDGWIVSWEWYVGGSSVGVGPSLILHDFAIGVTTITLIVTDNEGTQASDQIDVFQPGLRSGEWRGVSSQGYEVGFRVNGNLVLNQA